MSSPPDIPDYPPPSPTSAPSSPHGSTTGTEVGQDTLAQRPSTPSKNKEETKRVILEAVEGTPIREKVSTFGLHHKSAGYEPQVQVEMEPFYREEEYDKVMSSHVTVAAYETTPTLSEEQITDASRQADFAALHEVTDEAQMYEPLRAGFAAGLDAARAAHPHAKLDEYVFKDTSNWHESSWIDMRPDLAMYPATEKAKLAYSHKMQAYTITKPNVARVAWAWMTMPVEVKYDPDLSAFYFEEGEGLLRDSEKGKKAQAQIANYVTQIMIRQHRTFVFLLYVCQTKARITRWDRAGCIVSKPFDFVKQPEKLLNFIYRLALMSRSELGYDGTATLADEVQVKKLTEIVHVNEYARKCAEDILDPATRMHHPIYEVTCRNIKGEGKRSYFIGKHSTASYSVTGRGTKGYVMFILDENVEKAPRLGFLKDYWRTDSERIPKEFEIYELLKDKGVENVATAIGGGDVEGSAQRTVTDRDGNGSGDPPQGKLVHCRVALLELARPLDTYAHSGELIIVVYHALKAHLAAWVKAQVLHRDVSGNNIMIVVDQTREKTQQPCGILIDWDLCKYRNELTNTRTQDTRSGTWAFMSAASLQIPLKPHTLADDLESFIYVITFCSLRFHFHSMTHPKISNASLSPLSDTTLWGVNLANTRLCNHVNDYYHRHEPDLRSGFVVGGDQKLTAAELGRPGWRFDTGAHRVVSPALVNLVKGLYALLKKHYQQLDVLMLQEEYLKSSPPASLVTSLNGSIDGLGSHGPLVALFETAVREVGGWANREEKTQDQFHGLAEVVVQAPKLASGSHVSRASGKRSSDDVNHSSRTSKRSRKGDQSLHTVREGHIVVRGADAGGADENARGVEEPTNEEGGGETQS